jgi:hypothetical protein
MTSRNSLLRHAFGTGVGCSRLMAGAIVVFCVLICVGGATAKAQTSGLGTVGGTVTDPTGALVVGAKVSVTNVSTNVTENSVTNSSGYFEVDGLVPGKYKITVSDPGFESLQREGITLDAAAIANVPLQLHTGTVSQTMTVFGDVTLLNTEDGSAGQTLTTQQIEALPVSGSNPAWFIEMAPGVSTPFSQTLSTDGTLNWNGVSNFSTFGQQQKSEYSLDGAPNMQNRSNGINPTEDELGEMKFDVLDFNAGLGHTLGASVTQTTKTGTNQFHGAIRENYEDKRWSAKGHFQGLNYKYQEATSGCNGSHSTTKCLAIEDQYGWPGVHENDGNASIGGPISIPKLFSGRDKLFFFASVLDDVFSGTGTGLVSIPTVQERSGDFSDLPVQTTNVPAAFMAACGSSTPYYGQYQIYDPYSTTLDSNGIPRRTPICGNTLPASRLLNSAMATLYNGLLPTPSQNSPTGNNYNYSQVRPQTYRDYTGRVDWAVTQSDHAYFRYTRSNYTNDSSGFTVGDKDLNAGPRWIDTAAIGWNHIFNPRTNLDFTVGGTNFNTKCCYYPGYDQYSPASVGLPGYATSYTGSTHTLPVLSVSNYAQIGQVDNTNQYFRSLAYRGNLTRVQGRHTIRAGAEFRTQNFSQGIQGNTSGTYNFDNSYTQENNGRDSTFSQSNTGLSYAAFLMGVQTQSSASEQAAISIHTPYYALYVGDTWRASSKLTIIPGIRYEWEAGPVEKHNNQIVGWDATASLPIAAAANTAYQAALSSATPAQLAVLPPSLVIQGGPRYAGVNGAPTNEWNNNYRFLPRLAFSYQVRPNTVIRGGYGIFFDTLNALVSNIDQDGFSTSTSAPSSTTFGTNFSASAPPISNPFPVGANGSHFNSPVGSSAGSMFYVGQAPGNIADHSLVPSRQQRGYFGIQHQFGSSTMIEVAWLGGLTTDIPMNSQNYGFTPASFYAAGQQPNTVPNALLGSQIPNPFLLSNFSSLQSTNPAAYNLMSRNGYFTQSKISISSLIHAYPQMSGLSLIQSIGETKYQEVWFNVNRRYAQGLTLMGTVQLIKDLNRDYYANGFDTTPSWEASNNVVPVRVTAEGVYNLPFGRNKTWANSGWQSAILGGFQLSATLEAQSGQPIFFGNSFYLGDIHGSDIKLKKPVYVNNQASGGSNYIQWLTAGNATATPTITVAADGTTTTACTYSGKGFVTNPQCQPTGYNLQVFPRTVPGVRQIGWDSTNANMQKTFSLIKEKLTLDTRIEAYNVFNHLGLGGPNTNPTDPNFGRIFGDNQPNGRWVNISGHLRF